jgi:hypothetical protein
VLRPALSEVEKALAIPPSKQKLMYKGLLKDDTLTLQKVTRHTMHSSSRWCNENTGCWVAAAAKLRRF